MAAQVEPEIILYDFESTKGVCVSPVVWRIRMMLNYKGIPYKTTFLEFPDIEPTLKEAGVPPHDKNSPGFNTEYTVPTIHHLQSNTYIMDSPAIAAFLEKTYPDPALPLTSDLGREVLQKARAEFSVLHARSVRPREIYILPPRSAAYYRQRLEPILGCTIEELLAKTDEEEALWKAAHEKILVIDQLMRTNEVDGPFLSGVKPSYADFALVGSFQCARAVSEAVFEKHTAYPGFKRLYEACSPWLERKD